MNLSGKISFTTDCWTSPSMKSFMSITAHFINEKWELKYILLDFIEMYDIIKYISPNFNFFVRKNFFIRTFRKHYFQSCFFKSILLSNDPFHSNSIVVSNRTSINSRK